MATFLFNEIIFGPVNSRRLGISLGVNLLPIDKKFCNLDCLYCECGWTCNAGISPSDLPKRPDVKNAMEKKLQSMVAEGNSPDVITFAGNGEPTVHPDFPEIVNDTITLRNKYCKKARIAVLSNSMTLGNKKVIAALKKVDQAILKLDTAIQESFLFINRPTGKISIDDIIHKLAGFGEGLILQTLFFKGTYKEKTIDNTSPNELNALFAAYKTIAPSNIMIYTFERDTPLQSLKKIPFEELKNIAEEIKALGIPVEISA